MERQKLRRRLRLLVQLYKLGRLRSIYDKPKNKKDVAGCKIYLQK